MRKMIIGMCLVLTIIFNVFVLPVNAAEQVIVCAEPRYNNIARATLTIGFDANNVGHFCVSVTPYASCTGLSGQMRLLDENGNLLASWAIYDDVSPYIAERTYQCQEGRTYTVTFQGYAYGDGNKLFDDIEMSLSDTCD
jgi:hypothetical protein